MSDAGNNPDRRDSEMGAHERQELIRDMRETETAEAGRKVRLLADAVDHVRTSRELDRHDAGTLADAAAGLRELADRYDAEAADLTSSSGHSLRVIYPGVLLDESVEPEEAARWLARRALPEAGVVEISLGPGTDLTPAVAEMVRSAARLMSGREGDTPPVLQIRRVSVGVGR
jgi:hypothetical protein